MGEASNIEPNNTGRFSTYVPCDENDLGSSDQFIGNFLCSQGDLEHIVRNKILVTSDTHFNHRNILIYEAANRPFKDRDEMNEALVSRWNEKVGPSDVVFHLGDFAFAGKNFIHNVVHRLNGDIFILLGNHDRYIKTDWLKLGFKRVFRHPFLLDGKFVFSHEPLDVVPDGLVNIYGHVHGSKYFSTIDHNRLCACVERWNCAPIEYDYIKQQFKV